MKNPGPFCVLSLLATVLPAQEAGQEVAERIFGGGWFEQTKWRRGEDGSLETWQFAHTGDPDLARFLPLMGDEQGPGLSNIGALGWLSLLCHGTGDLVSMTDADYHLQALGLGTSNEELRQFLALPAPSFEGARGRAELLDRVLVVSLLARRGCKPAAVEIGGLAKNEAMPALLRERCTAALAQLQGGDGGATPRQHLDAQTMLLPAAFDGCLVIDHARLPDMGWLTPLARRLGALVTASVIEQAGGTVSASVCNGAQRMADMASEAPFYVAHQFGDARLDQSCFVINAKADRHMPFALTWEAAGAFEHERWQAAKVPKRLLEDLPWRAGVLRIEAQHLFASTDQSQGKTRPDLAQKLLVDTGAAIRAVVPANSKLWPALAFLELPPARGAVLEVTFGEVGTVKVSIEARDEESAEAWVEKGKALLVEARTMVESELADLLQQSPDARSLCDAVFATQLSSKESVATASIEVRDFTPAKLRAVAEAAAHGLRR